MILVQCNGFITRIHAETVFFNQVNKNFACLVRMTQCSLTVLHIHANIYFNGTNSTFYLFKADKNAQVGNLLRILHCDSSLYPVATSIAAAITAGLRTVSPGNITGIVNGESLVVARASVSETVVASNVTATTFDATFANSYGPGASIAGVEAVTTVRQASTTLTDAAVAAFTLVFVTPVSMAFIVASAYVTVRNHDGSNSEIAQIAAVVGATFSIFLLKPKSNASGDIAVLGTIVPGFQTVTPVSMVSIVAPVMQIVVADADGTNQEQVQVSSTTGTTFNGTFAKPHVGDNLTIRGYSGSLGAGSVAAVASSSVDLLYLDQYNLVGGMIPYQSFDTPTTAALRNDNGFIRNAHVIGDLSVTGDLALNGMLHVLGQLVMLALNSNGCIPFVHGSSGPLAQDADFRWDKINKLLEIGGSSGTAVLHMLGRFLQVISDPATQPPQFSLQDARTPTIAIQHNLLAGGDYQCNTYDSTGPTVHDFLAVNHATGDVIINGVPGSDDGVNPFQVRGNTKIYGDLAVTGAVPGAGPTGPAGGALAGTYPNPTLAAIADVATEYRVAGTRVVTARQSTSSTTGASPTGGGSPVVGTAGATYTGVEQGLINGLIAELNASITAINSLDAEVNHLIADRDSLRAVLQAHGLMA